MNKFVFHLIPSIYLNILLSFWVLFVTIELFLYAFRVRSYSWKYFFRFLPYFNTFISFFVFRGFHTAILSRINCLDFERGSRILGLSVIFKNGLPSIRLGFTSHYGEGYSFTLFDWIGTQGFYLWLIFSAILLISSSLRFIRLVFIFLEEKRTSKWDLTPYFGFKLSEKLIERLRRNKIEIFTSRQTQIPLLHSYFSPKIVLPSEALNFLSPGELKSVLLHEVAHHSVIDQFLFPLMKVLSEVFFLPIKHLELSREIKCDEFTIKQGAQKKDLLSSIKKIAINASKSKQLLNCRFIATSQIHLRVRHILIISHKKLNRWICVALLFTWVYLLLIVSRTQIAFF